MNKFCKVLAVAVMTCAAAGLAACEKKKSEETPAPAASTTAPAPAAETPAAPPAPAATPAEPAPATTPAPQDKKSEAAPPAAPAATEPAAPAESSPMAPATPAAAPEPEKKSEAPSSAPSLTTGAPPSAPDKPQQTQTPVRLLRRRIQNQPTPSQRTRPPHRRHRPISKTARRRLTPFQNSRKARVSNLTTAAIATRTATRSLS